MPDMVRHNRRKSYLFLGTVLFAVLTVNSVFNIVPLDQFYVPIPDIPVALLVDAGLFTLTIVLLLGLIIAVMDTEERVRKFPNLNTRPAFLIRKALVNRFFSKFPTIFYDWPNAFTLLFSGLVILAFVLLGSNEMVIVTAFYASVLFLNEILKSDAPRLRVRELGSSSRLVDDIDQPGPTLTEQLEEIDQDDNQNLARFTYQIAISNIGSQPANRLRVHYRVFNENGFLKGNGWDRIDEYEDHVTTLCPDDKEKNANILLDIADISTQECFYVEIRVYPSDQHRQLAYRGIIRTSIGEENEEEQDID